MNAATMDPHPRVSVVIVTWCRPDYVCSCLEHLATLETRPDEVIVVDATPNNETRDVVARFPFARYVSFPQGAGHMTAARNVGLLHATGEIFAFLDDDANVRPGWLAGLQGAFADPKVGAVAGRTCNGLPNEESGGVEAIGRLLPTGDLTGNFGANPASIIEVDHGIGANMSFSRGALGLLGGFRDDFSGVGGVREDTDVFLRVRALGYRIIFSPQVVVDHVAAPHVKGRRFDYRYNFWARRNHILLLARNFGIGSSYLRAYVCRELARAGTGAHPNALRRALRTSIGISGIAAGLIVSLRKARWGPTDPVRLDLTGQEIRRHLSALETTSPI